MTKTVLFASAAVALALSADGASAAQPVSSVKARPGHVMLFPRGGQTLYDQTAAGSGEAIDSQNFESTYAAYDDAAADDFVVPAGHTWIVSEVDVAGTYFNGSGPARSENVIFYTNDNGKPGTQIGPSNDALLGTDDSGSFAITLGNPVRLKPGKYWVSVVANCYIFLLPSCGEWGWSTSSTKTANPAQWQNPDGGLGRCPAWRSIERCIRQDPDPDLQFVLKGKDRS